uniref:Origin recognition complex subunit 2 n=1 Tax=Lynceus sp. MCZ IZ 141354 TaxID=1930659 RepID=A0A9N6WT02_9CRUS|nr:EOG090X0AVI [Lynceus sp. MCZ IZ 141354]
MSDHENQFLLWKLYLSESFNVLLYGLGSKKELIEKFHLQFLSEEDVIVVNGFFPSLTIKEILNSITDGILGATNVTFPSVCEHVDYIKRKLKNDLYLIIHNIDGPALSHSGKEQDVLSSLAAIKCIHVISSIDHINAPLMWDHIKQNRFKWVYIDATTFAPYIEETSYENSLLVSQSQRLAVSSLVHVFASLNPNAKGIFLLIAKRQLEEKDNSSYIGIPFHELYQLCREAFLVNSDLTLRAQLTEFKDHKLIRTRRAPDGTETLLIVLERNVMESFVNDQESAA